MTIRHLLLHSKMMPFQPIADTSLQALLGGLRFEEEFVFLETTRGSAENRQSMLFRQPVGRLRCTAADDPDRFWAQAEQYLDKGYYLAGWCAYELGYLLEPALAGFRLSGSVPLAEFGIYRLPHIYDHKTRTFAGAGLWPEREPPPDGYELDHLRPNLDKADYLAAVEQIKRYIEAGDTYQVNYTFKLLFDFTGSIEDFYLALRRNQSVAYGAYLRHGSRRILSFSPELFFRRQGTRCLVRPMKGTIGRGRTPEEDAELAAFLENDVKNRSENVMIVDLLRNDLGRLCRPGTVVAEPLFAVETYESLHQMTSTVIGELHSGLSLAEVFASLFPCGSVTGAPKIRTMQIIRELERAPRGVYTGAIGYLGPAGEAVFNVPIRTVVFDGGRGEMGIGSGIVYDSRPETEWEECLLKGRFLTHAQPAFELIETLVWLPGEGYWLLARHLARLEASARHFDFAFERKEAEQVLAATAGRFNAQPHRVRLALSKDGRLAVRTVLGPQPVRDLPPEDGDLPCVLLSSRQVDSGDRYRYHKTSLREMFEKERARAIGAGCFEVLFCNERGEITEGSITNVFIRQGGRLLTPPVRCGLLPGVFRQHFLENAFLPVAEVVLYPEDLATADALYVANSVRGLVQVRLELMRGIASSGRGSKYFPAASNP
jgi:para-aminobenzoate synthetase/4-amino-4-deoxychorismate lyase